MDEIFIASLIVVALAASFTYVLIKDKLIIHLNQKQTAMLEFQWTIPVSVVKVARLKVTIFCFTEANDRKMYGKN